MSKLSTRKIKIQENPKPVHMLLKCSTSMAHSGAMGTHYHGTGPSQCTDGAGGSPSRRS